MDVRIDELESWHGRMSWMTKCLLIIYVKFIHLLIKLIKYQDVNFFLAEVVYFLANLTDS